MAGTLMNTRSLDNGDYEMKLKVYLFLVNSKPAFEYGIPAHSRLEAEVGLAMRLGHCKYEFLRIVSSLDNPIIE